MWENKDMTNDEIWAASTDRLRSRLCEMQDEDMRILSRSSFDRRYEQAMIAREILRRIGPGEKR